MNGIILAFLGTMFTLSVTAMGALNVFWVKREVSSSVQCIFLGFAGGVMVAASVWSLLLPAIETANENNQISWLVVAGGFLAGVFLLLLADGIVQKRIKRAKKDSPIMTLNQNTRMLVLAITVHNIPEGMAVGLAFALAAQNLDNPGLMSGALALAFGIGIQNYPEGTAVALPLLKDGISKKKAFLVGTMSAVVEPVFGVLAAILSGLVQPIMPLLLALAAGTMIYVVVQELIPQAHMGEKDNIGSLGFIVGFLVMMILDVALG